MMPDRSCCRHRHGCRASASRAAAEGQPPQSPPMPIDDGRYLDASVGCVGRNAGSACGKDGTRGRAVKVVVVVAGGSEVCENNAALGVGNPCRRRRVDEQLREPSAQVVAKLDAAPLGPGVGRAWNEGGTQEKAPSAGRRRLPGRPLAPLRLSIHSYRPGRTAALNGPKKWSRPQGFRQRQVFASCPFWQAGRSKTVCRPYVAASSSLMARCTSIFSFALIISSHVTTA